MIYASGRYLNALERALSVTATPSADANYPVTRLYDGRPSAPFRFGSNAANPKVEVDLAAFTALSGTTNTTFTVRAGERRRITQTAGTTILRNLTTGKYCTSGGVWQTGTTNIITGSGGVSYQVEAQSVCLSDTAVMQVSTTSGTAVVDFPRWNCMALVGHSFDPLLTTFSAQSDDNSGFSSPTTVGSFNLAKPNAYVYSAGGVAERYARLYTVGTNYAAAWMGELVVCWMETATRGQKPEWSIKTDFQQVRAETRAGEMYAYPLSAFPRRIVQMSFVQKATAQYAEMRDEIVGRSAGGRYATLLNPYETETDVLVHGRLDGSWAARRLLASAWEDDLIISEDPFPVTLA